MGVDEKKTKKFIISNAILQIQNKKNQKSNIYEKNRKRQVKKKNEWENEKEEYKIRTIAYNVFWFYLRSIIVSCIFHESYAAYRFILRKKKYMYNNSWYKI